MEQNSNCSTVSNGVSQGSVIGLVLFVIFINDLTEVTQSIAQMFTDDTKVFRSMVSKEDRTLLQRDIDQLAHWADTW